MYVFLIYVYVAVTLYYYTYQLTIYNYDVLYGFFEFEKHLRAFSVIIYFRVILNDNHAYIKNTNINVNHGMLHYCFH